MATREKTRNQLLLLLDRRPCHGYELRRLLHSAVGDIEITKLYRWLRDMENEGLVESETQTGHRGPSRRVYRLGPRGERCLREVLRDSIGVVLHFYDAFRRFSMKETMENAKPITQEPQQGSILASVISPFMMG